MLIYADNRYKPRRKSKKKPTGPVAVKLDVSRLQRLKLDHSPTYNGRPLRPGADTALALKSHVTTNNVSQATARNSMMDAAQLAKEAPEVREAIIAKSKRLAPAYNKGAYQYVCDEAEIQTLGRKIK
jgi:hypothetical protein